MRPRDKDKGLTIDQLYQCRVFDGKRFRTKTFPTLEEAQVARERMVKDLHGDFARTA